MDIDLGKSNVASTEKAIADSLQRYFNMPRKIPLLEELTILILKLKEETKTICLLMKLSRCLLTMYPALHKFENSSKINLFF